LRTSAARAGSAAAAPTCPTPSREPAQNKRYLCIFQMAIARFIIFFFLLGTFETAANLTLG
jgi:hypothetical protein